MDRRSLRRTPRKKYNVDAFEGIEAIDGSSDDEHRSKSGPNNDDSGSADEFRQDDDEDIGMDDGFAKDETPESSNSSERATDDEDDDNEAKTIVDSRSLGSRPPRKHKKWKPPVIEPGTKITRGVLFGERNFSGASSKETRRRLLFGSSYEDYTSVRNALARWPRHPCMPSRVSSSDNTGGFARSLEHKGNDCEGSDADWKWFVDFGKKAFNAKQRFQPLPQSQALKYMIDSKTASVNVVLGPKDESKFFRLDLGISVALSVAWPGACAPGRTRTRTGFVLNLGSKVHCLEWAPNQISSLQYLAAAVVVSYSSESEIEASPFLPGPACESSIQIWELNADSDASINDKIPPKLRSVICATWGEVRALKWCPVSSTDSSRLGLLASLWGDGGARVFDITTPPPNDVTRYEKCQHAAFAEHPPDTVFTCITWLSSSLLAAGCANGYVAVYDLAGLALGKDHLRPIMYVPTSTTYISSIDSGWPSHPHILLSTSMNGLMFMTDLRQPQPAGPGATVTSQRVRSGTNHFIWSDYAQCALSVDDSSSVRCHPLRRFFSTMTVARARSITTSIASSRCHPYLLVGTAGGEVVAFNPVPRTMNKKSELWQYSWLQHEWRRPTAAEESFNNDQVPSERSSDPENSSTAAFSKSDNHLPDIRFGGLSRISDGPLTERIVLHEENVRQDSKVGANYTTIFEEKTTVTALSWNPNLHVGGWAAVGMCDGLVYIEDISMR